MRLEFKKFYLSTIFRDVLFFFDVSSAHGKTVW